MKKLRLFFLLLGLAGLIQGCSSTYMITAPVTRPCEINFKEYNLVCVDPCVTPFGNYEPGKKIDSTLFSYLTDSCKFKLITPVEFQDSLRTVGLKIPDVMKPENRTKLAKLGKIALISSKVLTYTYDNDYYTKDVFVRYYGRLGSNYNKEGLATVKIFFKITDLTSGKILLAKNFLSRSWAMDRVTLNKANREEQYNIACLDAVQNFSMFIHPFTMPVDIEFILDSDLPVLKEGIDLIGKGSWNEGIMKLESAVPLAKDEDQQAVVYYDLALAYQYTYSFDKAREAFTRLCLLSDDEEYFEAAENCKEMEENFIDTGKLINESEEDK